jgi:hypothetical protein
MTKQPRKKQWQPGDLVLLETGPKVHARLMEIIEINGRRARLALLDLAKPPDAPNNRTEVGWSPIDDLVDPALFIKTEEFVQTLRAHLARNGVEES